MPKLLLTQHQVNLATCSSGKVKLDLFDSNCKGLMVEIRASGGKTYYLRYVDNRGKTRQLKLADERDVTLAQAKLLADKMRNKIALGIDPVENKKSIKLIPTFGDFIKDSYMPYVKGYKKSWKIDEGQLSIHVLPHWGKKYLDQITKSDVISLMGIYQTSHAPASSNRLLVMIRYIFNLANRWEISGVKANPTSGYQLQKVNNKRSRYMTQEEVKALYKELLCSRNNMLQYIIPMLILTGCRKREVLDAKWEDIDINQKAWRINDTKSGYARHIPLSDGAIKVLNSVPRFNCKWVFPNPSTKKPYVSIFGSWDKARKDAGLGEVRLHDLRHGFASFLVNSGRTIYEVQKLLGHANIATTQRYAHLSQDTLLDATNAVSNTIGSFSNSISQSAIIPSSEITIG